MEAALLITICELIFTKGIPAAMSIINTWSKSWGPEGPGISDILSLRTMAIKPQDLFPGLDEDKVLIPD